MKDPDIDLLIGQKAAFAHKAVILMKMMKISMKMMKILMKMMKILVNLLKMKISMILIQRAAF